MARSNTLTDFFTTQDYIDSPTVSNILAESVDIGYTANIATGYANVAVYTNGYVPQTPQEVINGVGGAVDTSFAEITTTGVQAPITNGGSQGVTNTWYLVWDSGSDYSLIMSGSYLAPALPVAPEQTRPYPDRTGYVGVDIGIIDLGDLYWTSNAGAITYDWAGGVTVSGLTLGTDGYCTGTPDAAGDYPRRIEATNTEGPVDSAELWTWHILNAAKLPDPIAISNRPDDTGTHDLNDYNTGTPATSWAFVSGEFPSGATFNADGTITYNQPEEGTYTFVVQALVTGGDTVQTTVIWQVRATGGQGTDKGTPRVHIPVSKHSEAIVKRSLNAAPNNGEASSIRTQKVIDPRERPAPTHVQAAPSKPKARETQGKAHKGGIRTQSYKPKKR